MIDKDVSTSDDIIAMADEIYHILDGGKLYIGQYIDPIIKMIDKDSLEDGGTYIGSSRNTSKAKWNASRSRFEFERRRMVGTVTDELPHFDDEDGSDFFVPVMKIDE